MGRRRERDGKRERKRESDCVRVVLVFVYLWFVCLKNRDREREKGDSLKRWLVYEASRPWSREAARPKLILAMSTINYNGGLWLNFFFFLIKWKILNIFKFKFIRNIIMGYNYCIVRNPIVIFSIFHFIKKNFSQRPLS